MRAPWTSALTLLLLLATACAGESAPPVPRARAASGIEMRWIRPEILLEPIAPPPSAGIAPSDFVAALTEEARAWSSALGACNVPRISIGGLRAAGAAREDSRNIVVIRADSWCPTDGAIFGCYDDSREAITHVRTYLDRDGPKAGEIREADIEINAVNFRWSIDGAAPATRSLRAVFGHELGHVLGLAHACSNLHASPDRLDAVALPPCTAVTSRSIMYPDPVETGRPLVLTPTRDAIAGLCLATGFAREGS